METADIKKAIEGTSARGQWGKARKMYALELIEDLEERGVTDIDNCINFDELKKVILNGAKNFLEYSEGGCSLIWHCDIVKRLYTEKMQKEYDRNETLAIFNDLLTKQARCLESAFELIVTLLRGNCAK